MKKKAKGITRIKKKNICFAWPMDAHARECE